MCGYIFLDAGDAPEAMNLPCLELHPSYGDTSTRYVLALRISRKKQLIGWKKSFSTFAPLNRATEENPEKTLGFYRKVGACESVDLKIEIGPKEQFPADVYTTSDIAEFFDKAGNAFIHFVSDLRLFDHEGVQVHPDLALKNAYREALRRRPSPFRQLKAHHLLSGIRDTLALAPEFAHRFQRECINPVCHNTVETWRPGYAQDAIFPDTYVPVFFCARCEQRKIQTHLWAVNPILHTALFNGRWQLTTAHAPDRLRDLIYRMAENWGDETEFHLGADIEQAFRDGTTDALRIRLSRGLWALHRSQAESAKKAEESWRLRYYPRGDHWPRPFIETAW
ncbi:MAG: hypothetical protein Q3972_00805 [Corynebacterium sp.]|nr:hypothetical protein [Corynebacterium sp.]